jgi:predicted permease
MGATLSLGIGLTTAVFSVAYSILLRPLPYSDSQRLVSLWTVAGDRSFSSIGRFNVGAANWKDWREQSKSFEDIALTRYVNFNLTGDGPPERLQGARTWWNLFQVLGAQPYLGRVFNEEETQADAKVVVLSYRFWNLRFAGDPAVLGRKIILNDAPFQVIGIMPQNFWYPTTDFQLWTPLYIPPDELQSRWGFYYRSVGRLKPGVSLQQAQGELSIIMQDLAQRHGAVNGAHKFGVSVDTLLDLDTGQFRKRVYVLLGAVGCLLLIVCVNLGGLLIVRAHARAPEFALRAALGASGGRLRTQTLFEILPLCGIGSVGGVALSWLLLKIMLPWLPSELLSLGGVKLYGPVLAAAFVLTVTIVLIAAMLPARLASRQHLTGIMQQGSRTMAGGGAVRNALVSTQIAVTLVIVFAAGALGRNLIAVMNVNPGFATSGVLTMQIAVPPKKYAQGSEVAAYYHRLIERVKSLPGVLDAGVINILPLSGVPREIRPLRIEGRPPEELVSVDSRSITPGYLSAMGIPLLRGRDFSDHDKESAPLVSIVDDRLARQIFGSGDPLGKRFQAAVGPTTFSSWIEIVGVVGHVHNETLENDPRPQMYWPQAQQPQDRVALVIKTAGRPESFSSAVVEQIHLENPGQPTYDVQSTRELLDHSLQSRNLLTSLVALFGGSAMLLACLGLYGVASYATKLRLREFAVRLALGAQPGDIRRLVLGHVAQLWIFGSVIGLFMAWPASRLLRSVSYGAQSIDPIALAIAPSLLLVAALLAGLGPALKAGRVDPAVTLRGD